MSELSPAPDELGLASPALGPWFRGDEALPELGEPTEALAVTVTLENGVEWCAPAACTAEWAIATDPPPPALAPLRGPDGGSPFAAGALVVAVRLLPEVELRLAALASAVPSAGALDADAGAGRPQVHTLVLELGEPGGVSDLAQWRPADFPADIQDEAAQAAYLGLRGVSDGLENAKRRGRSLHRPAHPTAPIVGNGTGAPKQVHLHAFDHRGRALDPGAVASWWGYLAGEVYTNLWAHQDEAEQRTCAVATGHYVLLCSPHEGPLPGSHAQRLNLSGLDPVAGQLYSRNDDPPEVGLSQPDEPDLMPVPRAALLPGGTYQSLAAPLDTLFAGWTDDDWPDALARDFVRIALVDVESHLAGRDRGHDAQADELTRVDVGRNTAEAPFCPTIDSALDALLEPLTGNDPGWLMAPVRDRRAGPIATDGHGDQAFPEMLEFQVRALAGEGQESGDTVTDQRVLVTFPEDSLPADSWVRLWTHRLDVDSGRRFRRNGGAARASAEGKAHVVIDLPDGTAGGGDEPPRLSFDVMLVTNAGRRLMTEQRFDRPAVASGQRLALPADGSTPDGVSLWLCEKGDSFSRGTGTYVGGQTLVALDAGDDAPALVDLESLAADDLAPATVQRRAGADDVLIVTTPAYARTDEGDITGASAPADTTVLHRGRNLLEDTITTFGRPVPSMERREVAALNAGGQAALGSAPLRASSHEAPPAQHGHAGVPAAAESHGTGVALAGPAVTRLAELMRERAAGTLPAFVQAVVQAVPAVDAADGAGPWAAVLETIPHGVTGDLSIRAFLSQNPDFSTEDLWEDIKAKVDEETGEDLDDYIDQDTVDMDVLTAALDRVLRKTRDGVREGAAAMRAAIDRAEDLVYIETPALDALIDEDGADTNLVGALTQRLAARPALRVLICAPARFLPDIPPKLEAVRRAALEDAFRKLREAAGERVVLFTPNAGPGRRLHMAATTVVVDDVFGITGTTHLWRRGLTFDSSLAVALFDDTLKAGRPALLVEARRQLLADRLAIARAQVPLDAVELTAVIQRLIKAQGLGRITPDAYRARADETSEADQGIWNPDGRPGVIGATWYEFLGPLMEGDVDSNNAIR